MVSNDTVRKLALAFPQTDENPHFHRKAFRVKKKIFATIDEAKRNVTLILSQVDQSVFCSYDPTVISPVPGGWGRMGATSVDLKKVKLSMFKDALTVAYCGRAPKDLAEKYNPT